MVRQPSLRCRLIAIRQQCHWPAALKIADNRPVSLAAPEREVVDADDGELIARLFGPPAHDTQQGIIAHRYHQAIGKGGCRPAAQRQSPW